MAMGIVCASCGNPLSDQARFCGQCGALTKAGALPAQAPPGARSGSPLARTLVDVPTPEPDKNPLTQTLVDSQPPTLDAIPAAGPGAPGPAAPPKAPLDQTLSDTPKPVEPRPVNRTMLGFASPTDKVAAAPASPPTPGQPVLQSAKRTMLGVAASDVWGASPAASRPAAPPAGERAAPVPPVAPMPPAASAPMASPPADRPRPAGTILGVAIPGIAPTHPGQTTPEPGPLAGPPPRGGAPPAQGASRTMLGVAVPGIAPTHPGTSSLSSPGPPPHAQLRRAVEIVPRPAPPPDEEPLPAAPQFAPKRGVPLAVVAGAVAVLVLVAGVTVALLWKSSPLVAQPRVDAQGREVLHLQCVSCEDGTVAQLDGAKATFASKEAEIPLSTGLKVGDNTLTVHLDRPNLGRDEAVKLVVPIAYRVRADLGELNAAHPAITVRVEALPGTDVRVDGKPVALDANGAGSYAIDIASDIEGPADDARVIDRTIPYVITPKSGEPQQGKVSARVSVAPLRLDAPGLHAVVDGPTFHLAGRTVRGGSVTANGRDVKCDADGSFGQPFDAPALGDLPIELRAQGPQLAPRTAHLTVKRVEHLAEEAKAREQQPELGYDTLSADIPGSIGKNTIVQGEVVDARFASNQTVAVVDDARGCPRSPCLVRVVYGGDERLKHGDVVRAYGRVTRSVTSGTGTVPEVEADFIQRGRAPR